MSDLWPLRTVLKEKDKENSLRLFLENAPKSVNSVNYKKYHS